MTTIEMAQSLDKGQRDRGVARTIENAVKLARDPEWDKPRAIKVALDVINDFNLPADEYVQAINLLAEAFK
jgi:hypothetical protein